MGVKGYCRELGTVECTIEIHLGDNGDMMGRLEEIKGEMLEYLISRKLHVSQLTVPLPLKPSPRA